MSKNISTFDVKMELRKLTNRHIKDFKSLHIKKHRDASGLFIVEGLKGIVDSLSGFEPAWIICSAQWLESHPDFYSFAEKILIDNSGKGISQISKFSTPPDVIAVFKKPEIRAEVPCLDRNGYYLLLDDIQDPGNLGTIIRTCDWFGIYDIYASIHTADVYNPKVVQSSMGSLSRVRIHYLDLRKLILNNPEFQVVGTLLSGVPIDSSVISKPALIIMGNEGNGISEGLQSLIDTPVTIPPVNPSHHPDSLNVAIATAIVLSKIIS